MKTWEIRNDFGSIYVGSRELRPVVDRTFSFEEAPEALRRTESAAHFGKIVVQVRR